MSITKSFLIFSALFALLLFNGQTVKSVVNENAKEKVVVSPGKPSFIILSSAAYFPDEVLLEREKNELSKNFRDINPKVSVEYSNVIIFKNHNLKKFQFNETEEPFVRVLFWDGKMDSDPVLFPDLLESTEFFSEKLGDFKQSSYKIDFEKKKNDYLTPKEDNITKKSKEISDLYVRHTASALLFFLEKGTENFFPTNFKGVKSIKSVADSKNADLPLFRINFNKDGLPTAIFYKEKSSEKEIPVKYENGLVKEMLGEQIAYDEGMMFFYNDDTRTTYSSEKGFLLLDSTSFFDDDYNESWRKITLNGTTLNYSEDGGLNNATYKFNSFDNFFPISLFVAHSPEKENIINKKENIISENYIPDNKVFQWTLNEKGFIEKFSGGRNGTKELDITYIYEYY